MREYQRIDRISEEVRRELDAIIREELNDPRIDGTWSITRTEVTGELLEALKNAKGYLRRALGKRMIIRSAPELIFVNDPNIEYGVHIAKVLAEAGITAAGPEEEE